MTIPSAVVPAFPYEGGLYWFFGGATVRHPMRHPYYRSLYGLEPNAVVTRSAALACLFERIELASADHALPDRQSYSTGESYYHPDLRLSMSFEDKEWSPEGLALAKYVMNRQLLEHLFRGHELFKNDPEAQRHFLCRLVQQVRLAIRRNAILIGDDFFQEAYRQISPLIKQFVDDTPGLMPEGITLALNENTLVVVGLNFAPSNYDGFCSIRASKEVSGYAAAFREALGKANNSDDLQTSLLRLMKEAMESEHIAKLASGALQTTGSVMNVVGMLPVVGTGANIVDIASDIGERVADSQAKKQHWYLLGPRMKEIEISRLLRRL